MINLGWPTPRSGIPDFIAPAIPRDIFEALDGVYCDPVGWWIGQMVRYAFRLQPGILDQLGNISVKAGFSAPIVGYVDKCARNTGHL